ncbi:MAG: hypothetical protein RBR69_00235 [Candidatus Cloacimonadaceae bacterium]|nr:hypothetical protein [Candidatus Cloacimonadota bacterium]MDY0126550.1 hypothetical protein [Candidatus Cloacimonadaceae bacterium]MCB5254642.1 hypothetical protein [Candidatus Cloacimonadota bacterium]MCK9177729.1 hypothetical protein [Candidatus Cloacimonadota bacterium]MCK9241903.1 hypothetical protein [Candidatus Cloacimonadota bacterium]
MKSAPPLYEKYPYLISLALHALILLIFAIISLNVKPQAKWQQFEWISASEPTMAASSLAKADAAHSASETSVSSEGSQELESHQLHDIESPAIASPAPAKTRIKTAPLRETSLGQTLNPSVNGSTGAAEAAGSSLSLIEGGSDAYFIHETKPRITPLEDDVVIVEFALSSDGRVKMNSVNVISYRRAAHWEALREEMHSWRFGFTGAYKAEKRYRIRCNFKLR